WYPYSEAYIDGKSSASDYVKAWRHIVDIFRKTGADNVAWVWSPSVVDVGSVPAWKYYPGDEYVDWIGVSFYSSNNLNALDSLYQTHSQRKPFFITEWATSTDKNRFNPKFSGEAAWVNGFFNGLETRYKRVKAISWFEWSGRDGNYMLERVPAQQKVYMDRIKNERYLANF
ncbi:MAG: hypothetical protein EOP09_15785, partial [Proteobacteria bacterium]